MVGIMEIKCEVEENKCLLELFHLRSRMCSIGCPSCLYCSLSTVYICFFNVYCVSKQCKHFGQTKSYVPSIEPALSTSAGSYNYLTFKVLLSFSLSTIIIVIWRLGDEGGLEMRDLQLRSLLCWLG